MAKTKLNILATIKPYYNLTAAVVADVTQPKLLLENYASPHNYQLSPKDVIAIKNSDIIIWGGSNLEPYLSKILADPRPGQKIIDVSAIPGITLYEYREHDHHAHHHAHDDESNSLVDPHLWLDPSNAAQIVKYIQASLDSMDRNNKQRYSDNTDKFLIELTALDNQIQHDMQDINKTPYIVFHDAYQYFEKYYNLQQAFVIQPNPEIPGSTSTLVAIEKFLSEHKIACVFQEPQFDPKIIKNLQEKHNVHVQEIDPLGNNEDLGKNGYLELLKKLASNIKLTLQKCSK